MTRYTGIELADWADGRWDPHAPGDVSGVSNDTRTLGAGAVYVALKGERFDGHKFVANALDQGACGAVVDASWVSPEGVQGPFLRVADTRAALHVPETERLVCTP